MAKPIKGKNGWSMIPASRQDPFITVTRWMSGFFAVCLWFNPEMGGFWEPWDTHPERRASQDEAEFDAKAWSIESSIEYRHSSMEALS